MSVRIHAYTGTYLQAICLVLSSLSLGMRSFLDYTFAIDPEVVARKAAQSSPLLHIEGTRRLRICARHCPTPLSVHHAARHGGDHIGHLLCNC
jgi:hypothetical protein